MKQAKYKYFSGTSNLVLPVPKRLFPPDWQDKSRLQYYASLFNSVEINSSFYKVPMASTVQKWADSVHDNFQFTFKLWKEITHNKGLIFNADDVKKFVEVINHAGNKKGCLLVQFPPSVNIANLAQLKKLLVCLRRSDPDHQWKIAIEFRNSSWYLEKVFELLFANEVGVVLHDLPSSALTSLDSPVGFVYLRFHGPGGGYRGSYADDFLHEYSRYIVDWTEEQKDVYVYFNNTMGEALKNLITLNTFVARRL